MEERKDCSECGGKNTFGYNTETGVYHCFKCGKKGNSKKKADFQKNLPEFIWKQSVDAAYFKTDAPEIAYLKRKCVKPYNNIIKVNNYNGNSSLVIPLIDIYETIHNLQFIDNETGKKKVMGKEKAPDGVTGFFNKISGNGTAAIAEGYATAASIYEATGKTVYIAFNGGNLEAAFESIKSQIDIEKFVVCSDNDHSYVWNPGLSHAQELCLKYNLKIAYPTDIAGTDFNDMALEKTPEAVKSCIASADYVFSENFQSELLKKIETDKGLPFENENLRLFGCVKRAVPAVWQRFRSELKKNEIGMGDLDNAMKLFEKNARKQNADLRPPAAPAVPPAAAADATATAQEKKDDLSPDDDYIKYYNESHFVTFFGGKCRVVEEYMEPIFNRPSLRLMTVRDFQDFNVNRRVPAPTKQNPDATVSTAKLWLEDGSRREFKRGIIFAPGMPETPNYYNLWRGLNIKPKKGTWQRFEDHLFHVVADGDESLFQWIKAWFASLMQKPGDKMETCIVLLGKQGTGKDLIARYVGPVFGGHYLHLKNQSHLVGKHNFHLQNALFVFSDEAFWTGNTNSASILKSLITDDTNQIEPKGVDAYSVKNYVSLVVASDSEEWVIPAKMEDRRFCVCRMNQKFMQKASWFDEIYKEMETGGREAMLYDMLEFDVSGFNLRNAPKTQALMDQIVMSGDSIQQFWHHCLSEEIALDGSDIWGKWIESSEFYQIYFNFVEKTRKNDLKIPRVFFKKIKNLCGSLKRVQHSRKWGYEIPELSVCRYEFQSNCSVIINWEE